MGLFKKKTDPFGARARALNEQIAELEDQIRQLADAQSKAQPAPRSQPRLRSTALPYGANQPVPATPAAPRPVREPIFEEVERQGLGAEPEASPEPDQELGVRKFDLASVWQRWRNHFRGPAAANPRLVNYLAAGSIQGLRPLRYEKRVARNRFLLLVAILVLVLWGLFAAFLRK
jgi:hypothetical protein